MRLSSSRFHSSSRRSLTLLARAARASTRLGKPSALQYAARRRPFQRLSDESARRNHNHIQDWHLPRDGAATDFTEPVSEPLRVRHPKRAHLILSTQPPKISGPHKHVRSEGGAARLPAPRTGTVAKHRWTLGLEGDRAGQTTSSKHPTPQAKAIHRRCLNLHESEARAKPNTQPRRDWPDLTAISIFGTLYRAKNRWGGTRT